MPDSTTLSRVLRRRNGAVLGQAMRAVVQRLASPPSRQATVAVDATGLAPGAISPLFGKRAKAREPGVTWRHWLKWAIAVDVDRRVTLAQTARRGPAHEGAVLRPLVDRAQRHVSIGLVVAEAEVDSERNQQYVRHVVQAQRVMPAKRGAATWHIQGRRAQMRRAFPAHLDRRRSLIESVIAAVKRKLSARAPGRSLDPQCLPALLLGIADSIYCL